ncbi:odorant receptor 46a-like [Diachasmimorpha longicaudata]|uniref:odorant receptor 46a-like n=1 Tax=Diachasmimorpha longicaudata TaxID=58733 RepID=UPI0030B87684
MKVLPFSFGLFTFCGVWRPLSWSTGWKKVIYDFYSIFVVSCLYSYGLMEFADTIRSLDEISEFINASFMLVSVINTSCKTANLLIKRDQLIELLSILDNNLCRSRSGHEDLIQAECGRRVKINFLFFFCIVETAVMTSTVSSIFENIPERTLPFRVWVPYYNNSELAYWCLYLQQVIVGHGFQSTIAIGNDTLVAGMMLLTCAQLQILKHRQENLPRVLEEIRKEQNLDDNTLQRQLLNEIIYHHKTILKFATTANDLFSTIIFIQYAISCYVLCISVYRVAQMEVTNPEYPFTVFYLLCMTTQIFYFCWYGNEVILESSSIGESLYQMTWTDLNTSVQKDLIMIMNRTTHPIVFTSGKIIILSVESFKGIMKLSYTAFNVLQQT